MNKKVISIVAIIMLVAVLAICLTACNAESISKKLENKGYTVAAITEDQVNKYVGEDTEVKWGVFAKKDGFNADIVVVVKVASIKDAKQVVEDASSLFKAKNIASVVYIATTEEALKDAM
ncbi:MAG: hypothetical protein ACLUE6_00525 [Acutalibacteraceae bacterium]